MLAGLIARIAVTLLAGENTRAYYEYMSIAQNLLDGNGYSFDEWGRAPLQPSSFLPPLYTYWCTFFMWLLGDNYTWMYISQAIVAISGCIPAFFIGRSMFSSSVGTGFAAAYAFYPEFVYTHSRPVTEFVYLVLSLWMIVFYLWIKEKWRQDGNVVKLSIGLGVVGASSVLIKEGASILAAAICVSLLWKQVPRLKLIRRCLIPMGIAAILVMTPWVVRNYIVQGEFIPVRTGYGLTFWLANHPGATGTDKTMNGEYILAHMDSAYQTAFESTLPADEQDRDRVYRAEGKRFVRENTAEYVSLTLKRLLYFVWFDPTHPIARNLIYRVSYILLLFLAIPGIIWAYHKKKLDPAIILSVTGYLVLYVPVIVLPRYRIIPVLFLVLFAGVSIAAIWESLSRQSIKTAT